MTTIALDKDGLVAYDSRESVGSRIVDDDMEKMRVVEGVRFWFCGRSADEDYLIDALLNGPDESYPEKIEVQALIYKDGVFLTAGLSDSEGFIVQRERKGNPVALGSGSDNALTAMDCGKSAKEAVKMAIKRDMQSGGTIRTFDSRKA